MHSQGHEQGKEGGTVDLYRDTWIRFFGYTNEVGEALRPVIPAAVVWSTYGAAALYVLLDTVDKGRKALKLPAKTEKERRFNTVSHVADTLVWQTLASLLVPPLIINRTCKITAFLLNRTFPPMSYPSFSAKGRGLLTSFVGLSIIPLIVHPIDHAVHVSMNYTLSPWTASLKQRYSTSEETRKKTE